MDDFTYHDALWDSLDSYRTDTVTGGPESLGVKRVDPSFADGPLEPLCIPSAGNSSQSGPALQWSHYVIYQGPDEKMIANIFIRPGQIGCLRGHQDRHQPVVNRYYLRTFGSSKFHLEMMKYPTLDILWLSMIFRPEQSLERILGPVPDKGVPAFFTVLHRKSIEFPFNKLLS
ncbi:hypothetical protein MMC16_004763 [Acarospora aff. strigata]|nr:hypothetical protein [Acarospora aff. strigata]